MSVVSDSVWPHGWQPTRLPRPWDSPGKNTGVGCHFLLQCMKVKSEIEVAQSCRNLLAAAAKSLRPCPTLCDPIDSSPPGCPVPGSLQTRILEWVAISFSNVWKSKVKVKSLSCVRLLETPWTAAHQAPPSLGFSRQEHWSGLPFPSPMHETEKWKWSRSVVSEPTYWTTKPQGESHSFSSTVDKNQCSLALVSFPKTTSSVYTTASSYQSTKLQFRKGTPHPIQAGKTTKTSVTQGCACGLACGLYF